MKSAGVAASLCDALRCKVRENWRSLVSIQPYPQRPPRLSQVFGDLSSFYFITFNTHQRLRLLDNARVHAAFAAFASIALDRNVAVGRYVIMPDHVHLFVRLPPEGIGIGRWIQSLKTVLGKDIAAAGGLRPHWQQGFFDHLMRSRDSYAEKWAYVRDNPVRANLCKHADEWPYQGEIVSIMW
jgi:putative transposase